MSEAPTIEEAAAEDGVPVEVEAMDGVASEEEAHNVERPARGSGIHKHKDDETGIAVGKRTRTR